jgi:hypothetical protein
LTWPKIGGIGFFYMACVSASQFRGNQMGDVDHDLIGILLQGLAFVRAGKSR